ncbi:MAG: acyl-coenzyme A thioesterase PaaI-like protein [Bacteroidia bacterium]|jgi:acyl-coenzyme A thioesterase PaaI-like protein
MGILTPVQKANLKFKLVGLFKIRMLGFVNARLVQYTDEKTVVKIPLNRKTRNHLGSVYFGALAVGADVTGAWIAFDYLDRTKKNVSIVFKDLQAEFLKRADGDVHFTCLDGPDVLASFKQTILDGERKNIPLTVTATVPSKYGEEPVATFAMTLSMRYKKK